MLISLFSGGIGARDAASAIALWYLLESDLCWFRWVARVYFAYVIYFLLFFVFLL